MNRAIFFDRDGVLNQLVKRDGGLYSPRKSEDYSIFEESIAVVRDFKKLDFHLLVISNQPDISRGFLAESELKKMTSMLLSQIPIDEVFYCIHDDWEACSCRKPLPGLIIKAAHKWNIDLDKSYYVGDTWRDVEAAKNAGVRCLLLNRDYNKNVLCDRRINNMQDIIKSISED